MTSNKVSVLIVCQEMRYGWQKSSSLAFLNETQFKRDPVKVFQKYETWKQETCWGSQTDFEETMIFGAEQEKKD